MKEGRNRAGKNAYSENLEKIELFQLLLME